jgi:hypothetical protein
VQEGKPTITTEQALEQVALITANFGDGVVLADVLSDWFKFLGGRPGQVVLLDNGSDAATRQATWQCFEQGLIDKLLMVHPKHGDTGKERAHIAEHTAPAIATKPYLLFVKIDTLPFREGHDQWLAEAIAMLDREDTFAVGGSFNVPSEHHPAEAGWYFSHKCSENFALMKREKFIAAIEEFAGAYISSGYRSPNPAAQTGQDRFLIEVAWERYIEKHQVYTLVRREDPSWTVFHTNVHNQQLAQVRQDYLQHKNVQPYMNAGRINRVHSGCYYGMERYRWDEFRWAVGDSPLGSFVRFFKRLFKGQARV